MIYVHRYLLFLFLPGITRLMTRPAAIKPSSLLLSILLSLQLTTGDETATMKTLHLRISLALCPNDVAGTLQWLCSLRRIFACWPCCCCAKLSCAIFTKNVRKKQYQVVTTVNQINLSSGTKESITVNWSYHKYESPSSKSKSNKTASWMNKQELPKLKLQTLDRLNRVVQMWWSQRPCWHTNKENWLMYSFDLHCKIVNLWKITKISCQKFRKNDLIYVQVSAWDLVHFDEFTY